MTSQRTSLTSTSRSRTHSMRGSLLFLSVVLLLGFFRVPNVQGEEVRAIWVTRWDFRQPEDMQRIMRNAASVGFNTVYLQVRGEGTVFYPSRYEPWAWEFGGSISRIGTDPGWDPLATAIREAHRYGLSLHAYMNVLPGWNQIEDPPERSRQLYVAHRDWFMVDSRGRTMSPKKHKFYAFLNPAHPKAREHLVRVFTEVAQRYPRLDGIHFDYIRYPDEVGDLSHDPISLSEFATRTGGRKPHEAPDLWNRFRCYQINLLVTQLVTGIRKANPRLEISSAVIANYDSAVVDKAQRWLEWPDRNLLDTAAPMAYSPDMAVYKGFLDTCLRTHRPKRGKIVIGIWPAEKWERKGFDQERMAEQISLARRMGADGVALFAYSRFFPEHRPNEWARYLRKHCFTKSN